MQQGYAFSAIPQRHALATTDGPRSAEITRETDDVDGIPSRHSDSPALNRVTNLRANLPSIQTKFPDKDGGATQPSALLPNISQAPSGMDSSHQPIQSVPTPFTPTSTSSISDSPFTTHSLAPSPFQNVHHIQAFRQAKLSRRGDMVDEVLTPATSFGGSDHMHSLPFVNHADFITMPSATHTVKSKQAQVPHRSPTHLATSASSQSRRVTSSTPYQTITLSMLSKRIAACHLSRLCTDPLSPGPIISHEFGEKTPDLRVDLNETRRDGSATLKEGNERDLTDVTAQGEAFGAPTLKAAAPKLVDDIRYPTQWGFDKHPSLTPRSQLRRIVPSDPPIVPGSYPGILAAAPSLYKHTEASSTFAVQGESNEATENVSPAFVRPSNAQVQQRFSRPDTFTSVASSNAFEQNSREAPIIIVVTSGIIPTNARSKAHHRLLALGAKHVCSVQNNEADVSCPQEFLHYQGNSWERMKKRDFEEMVQEDRGSALYHDLPRSLSNRETEQSDVVILSGDQESVMVDDDQLGYRQTYPIAHVTALADTILQWCSELQRDDVNVFVVEGTLSMLEEASSPTAQQDGVSLLGDTISLSPTSQDQSPFTDSIPLHQRRTGDSHRVRGLNLSAGNKAKWKASLLGEDGEVNSGMNSIDANSLSSWGITSGLVTEENGLPGSLPSTPQPSSVAQRNKARRPPLTRLDTSERIKQATLTKDPQITGPAKSVSPRLTLDVVAANTTSQDISEQAPRTAPQRLKRRESEPGQSALDLSHTLGTPLPLPSPSRSFSVSSASASSVIFEPSEILSKFLYLGPEISSLHDAELLRKRYGIRRILNAACEIEEGGGTHLNLHDEKFSGFEKYKKIPLKDSIEATGVQSYIEEACAFLDDARLHSAPTYVHCKAGKSRSVMLVMAYLIHANRWSLPQSYAYVVERRDVSPNIGFVAELMAFEEKRLDAGGGRRSDTGEQHKREGMPTSPPSDHARINSQAATPSSRRRNLRESMPLVSSLNDMNRILTTESKDTEQVPLDVPHGTPPGPTASSTRNPSVADGGMSAEYKGEDGRYHARRPPADERLLAPHWRTTLAAIDTENLFERMANQDASLYPGSKDE